MKKKVFKAYLFPLVAAFLLTALGFPVGQQIDVPEPTFLKFPSRPSYVPVYRGRDPFKPLGMFERPVQLSIIELEFNGVVSMGGVPMALFSSWRAPETKYILKARKLYGANDRVVDGVVGDIRENEVVLVQGNQKIPYTRKKRRP